MATKIDPIIIAATSLQSSVHSTQSSMHSAQSSVHSAQSSMHSARSSVHSAPNWIALNFTNVACVGVGC